jgi:hypothetical protein
LSKREVEKMESKKGNEAMKIRKRGWAITRASGVTEATTEKNRALDLVKRAKAIGLKYTIYDATITYTLPTKPKRERK